MPETRGPYSKRMRPETTFPLFKVQESPKSKRMVNTFPSIPTVICVQFGNRENSVTPRDSVSFSTKACSIMLKVPSATLSVFAARMEFSEEKSTCSVSLLSSSEQLVKRKATATKKARNNLKGVVFINLQV